MNKDTYILFTAGRGPVECALAMQGVQQKFRRYLESKKVKYEIVKQRKGEVARSVETIVFKVMCSDHSILTPWLGSILWICQSPIRKYHKRKNWYIKCEEIAIGEKPELSLRDVTVQAYRASGPGGQHRNKVETAVRIIHKGAGVVVTATDGKSQSQNKKKAWSKLIAKLDLLESKSLEAADTDQWTSQIEVERGRPTKTFCGRAFRE